MFRYETIVRDGCDVGDKAQVQLPLGNDEGEEVDEGKLCLGGSISAFTA